MDAPIITVYIINEKNSWEERVGFGPCVINNPCHTMKTMAPNKQKIMKETNNPRQTPLLMFKLRISSIALLYFPRIKYSLVNDFTFEIPINDSSIMELDAAAWSCAFLESLRINRPKTTAIIAMTGTVASMIKASFHERKTKNAIPPITITICLKNSAIVVRIVSCTWAMSEESLLVNSPTLLLLKKSIGMKMRRSNAALRISRSAFSVTLVKITTLK